MAAVPADPLTRIAELERQLAELTREWRRTRRRGAERVTARETWPAITSAAGEGKFAYPEGGDLLPVIFQDGIVDGGVEWIDRSPVPRVLAMSPVGWLPPETKVNVAWDGRFWRIIPICDPEEREPFELIGCCLAEDHPGRGTKFDVEKGTWDPIDTVWIYDGGTVKAIDWRYGVPYPQAGATGLFTPRPWIVGYGTYEESEEQIWECVALDCASPGECGD